MISGMPEPQRYLVHEAILTKRAAESVWTLTFRPMSRPPDAPFDPDAGRDIVVTVTPERVDEMEFGIPYTKDEIETFSRG
jgi:hypothetical protein